MISHIFVNLWRVEDLQKYVIFLSHLISGEGIGDGFVN